MRGIGSILLLAPLAGGLRLTVPATPNEMMSSAAAAVRRARDGGCRRQLVNIVVPLPETVLREGKSMWDQDDPIDPWPGGLKQQYPYALDLARSLMQEVLGVGPANLQDQVLDAEDACGLVTAQGATPTDDAALMIFCGCDQLEQLEKVDRMCGEERLLVLLNPQFRRLSDFGIFERGRASTAFFERGFETAYSFEEFACRGEDAKLVGEWAAAAASAGAPSESRWRAYVMLSDTEREGRPLHEEELEARPDYVALEKMINTRFPSPRWARNLDEVEAKGLRFMRKGGGEDE